MRADRPLHCLAAAAFCVAALLAPALPAAAQAAPAATPDGGWTPLDPARFGSELFAPWIPVPNGSSGAPRQGWLATADGFFTREVHLAYDHVFGNGDANEVLARFNYPLSRRLWAGLEVPFYQESGGRTGFGDVTLATRAMLLETRDVSVNSGVAWRLPTGRQRQGNGVFAPQPQINGFADIGHGVSLRGAVGYDLPDRGRPDAFVLNAAIGQTLTAHDRAPFGDFTYYVAANWRAPSRGSNFLSVTPGLRTHLGGNLFALVGVEVPVVHRDETFRERLIFQLVQGF